MARQLKGKARKQTKEEKRLSAAKRLKAKENCIKVLDTLNKCNCCPRHKINRISVEDYEKGATGDFPDKNTHLYVKMRCECDCRHLTRIICHRLRELDEN